MRTDDNIGKTRPVYFSQFVYMGFGDTCYKLSNKFIEDMQRIVEFIKRNKLKLPPRLD